MFLQRGLFSAVDPRAARGDLRAEMTYSIAAAAMHVSIAAGNFFSAGAAKVKKILGTVTTKVMTHTKIPVVVCH